MPGRACDAFPPKHGAWQPPLQLRGTGPVGISRGCRPPQPPPSPTHHKSLRNDGLDVSQNVAPGIHGPGRQCQGGLDGLEQRL